MAVPTAAIRYGKPGCEMDTIRVEGQEQVDRLKEFLAEPEGRKAA